MRSFVAAVEAAVEEGDPWVSAICRGWVLIGARRYNKGQRALLEACMPALSAVLEGYTSELLLSSLLQVYLGADPGERVRRGEVQLGQLDIPSVPALPTAFCPKWPRYGPDMVSIDKILIGS